MERFGKVWGCVGLSCAVLFVLCGTLWASVWWCGAVLVRAVVVLGCRAKEGNVQS